ncbi:MAG: copper-binding protein [Hyphomicrobiales bacterium]|nr:MAG: copper-binding protein [Hyphomicrobiales bacterium]
MLRAIPFAAALALLSVPALAADHAVEIRGTSFEPDVVAVAVGDTVTFVNTNRAVHTATADDGSFDTGRLKMGETATVTVESAGTATFKCTVHPGMRGRIEAK